VVRRVFRDFANGISPRAIAQRLNAENIPGPGKQLWNATTLRGHNKRGTGLINNELYVVDHDRRTGTTHHRRCALASGQGPASEYQLAICWRDRGDARRVQPPQCHPQTEVASVGTGFLRLLQRTLFASRPGPLCLLGAYRQWQL
jgi:hypothetical protein